MENKIDDKTAKVFLSALFEWAKQKAQEVQPPWAFYRYMQLSDVAEIILDGMNSTIKSNCVTSKKDNLPRLAKNQGKHLRLVENNEFSQDTFQPHQDRISVNLPM